MSLISPGTPLLLQRLRLQRNATAGESEGILGLRVSGSSLRMSFFFSSNSSGSVDLLHVHVSLLCLVFLRLLPLLLLLLRLLLFLHSTPMPVAHNSWSDTGRAKGPTGTRNTKGGVSGPAEDLRPVSKMEAVHGGRLQVHFPGGNQAQVPCGTGLVWSHLPSTRRFLTPDSRHLDVGWASGKKNGLDDCVWNRTVGDLGAEG